MSWSAKELVIGVDVGAGTIKGALFNPDNWEMIPESLIKVATEPKNGVESVTRKILSIMNGLVKKAAGTKIKCAGLCMPGSPDPISGKINGNCANIPGADDYSFLDPLAKFFPFLIFAFNDSGSHLYGEYKLGAGVGFTYLVGLALGTGIGGGTIIKGELISGNKQAASEFGHLKVDYSADAPICSRGDQGCLESFAGTAEIKKRWAHYQRIFYTFRNNPDQSPCTTEYFPKDDIPNVKDIFKQAELESNYLPSIRQKCVCYLTVDDISRYVSRAVCLAVTALAAEIVICSGQVCSEPFFIELIRQKTVDDLPDFQKDIKIVQAVFPNESAMRGAAALAYERAWDLR